MTAIVSVQNSFNNFQKHDIPHPAVSYLVGGICWDKSTSQFKSFWMTRSFLMMMFSPARLLGIEFSAILATRLGLVWMIFHPLPASSESRSSVLMWTVPHPPFWSSSTVWHHLPPFSWWDEPWNVSLRVWIVSQIVHIRGNFRVGKL